MLGALKAVPGVKKAEVSLKTGTATVLYDKKVKAADLVKTINAISHRGEVRRFKATVLPAKSRRIGQGNSKHSGSNTPMISLTILSEDAGLLKAAFNKESDKTRLILLVSPT